MKFEHDGLQLWYGTSDAPAPGETVETDRAVTVTVAVWPADASNHVAVIYRINGGTTRRQTAVWWRNASSGAQYFVVRLGPFRSDDLVEYGAICYCAGRQVPSAEETGRLHSSFRVINGGETPSPTLASRTEQTGALRAEALLPLMILAGPIVRRVEPRLVCIWVAVSRASAVLLTVFEDRQQVDAGSGIFTGGQPKARGAANTLRVGEQLHVGVVVAEVPPPQPPLTPGQNYSYNLALGPFLPVSSEITSNAAVLQPGQVQPTADLKSLGLLKDQTIAGRPHLALGYQQGELPGFALPPAELTDLRILHGSCRRPGFVYPEGEGNTTFDGLAWVDDLIKGWRGTREETAFDANVRPHQLFLTGDQIYADDVAGPLLPMLNQLGSKLLGKVELLPTRYPPHSDEPSKEAYLGVPRPKGFATLREFVERMKAEKKDPLVELKRDRRVRVLMDPCLDRRYRLVYEATFAVDSSVRSGPVGVRLWPADLLHFPAGLRQPVMECEARFTSDDLGNHLMSFGEYCAMYLAVFSNAVWPLKDGRPALATIEQVYALPGGSLPQIWELHACFPDGDKCFARTDRRRLRDYFEKRANPIDPESPEAEEVEKFTQSAETLNAFYDSLPRVRRALANIPTYMVFDDHDITDDWNLSRAWRDQVHTAPLGRQIVVSALVAYALFQDWGNDPKRYRQGDYRELLTMAFLFVPPGDEIAPPTGVVERLARLLALNQPDPEQPPPPLKWHFTIDGPRHRVVALDTRTRRHYRSRYLPPGLLSPAALDEQLPDPAQRPLPAGIDVLVVVSQTSVGMPSLASSLIVPLSTRMNELSNYKKRRNLVGVSPDNEIWPGDDRAYEDLLRRLAAYRRVVVLSGEIHYGFSAQLSYWGQGPRRLGLPAGLQAALDGGELTASLRGAFQTAGFPLSGQACLVTRQGNDEWLVIDPGTRRMFLVRKENTGLNVYEEEEPARVAQFTSSGLKNVVEDLVKWGPQLGFAFALVDLTPAERLIWKDSTPPALRPPEGHRFPPAARDRVGAKPVLLPSGNWPAGTRIGRRPDFCWRMDLVRDERPDDGANPRPDFARACVVPEFDPLDLDGSYHEIANAHAQQLDRLRFSRGAMLQNNLGLVRFEHEGEDLVACHDLYSHRTGQDDVMLVNAYRVALQLFGEQRPRLRFDLPDGG